MRAAVLEAAIAELAESGYAALTVDNVARRAGVHKTTIYRNWKDSDSLVTQALAAHFAADVPVPDTGSVTTDLRELARSLVTTLMTPTGRALLNAVLSDAAHLPQVANIKRALFDDRFRRAEPVVARAIDRGELPKETDPVELLKALAAPVYFRLVCTGEPIDETTADRAAEGALAAARAGALSSSANSKVAHRSLGSNQGGAAIPVKGSLPSNTQTQALPA
ncbi:TetR family transcriptional regulator [Streptomyces sp. KhCrAH-43]|uniref:TetR/AcrR family transcriptional regulator n=1 Tax=unclassified Streptomyces TaxID=2593676 RepID=UPI00037AB411|nr:MULTISPECIES: TetR/AcrR family transcriptional regulator [unclassified Streptomyces]MYS33691.1 TetR family transcriptional regulator [Streptomyces sp. SID4920]MYX67414.1 TetR family transcriptional regulator [Streptomyces sp. SID8373]RAJ48508.1 TetR family transcriptional regulator [Streptomyces sp. KhCrAH-43]